MAMDYSYQSRIQWRDHTNRYAFHNGSNFYHRRPVGSCYHVSVADDHTTERVTYRVPTVIYKAEEFPLREIMYTFAEQIGVHVNQLEFKFKGKIVALNATPASLGMRPDEEVVLFVRAVSSAYEERVENFTRLNRMGKVEVGIGAHQGGDHFGTDLLPHVLEFAGLGTLVTASQVCRHWFHVSQRFSVLLQLQDGDSDAWQGDQRYPRLLHDGCRHSFNLALCKSMDLAGNSEKQVKWNASTMHKEIVDNDNFGYCKAAGCRMIKTVEMQSISRELASKWEALNNAKTAFMNRIETAQQATENDQKQRIRELQPDQVFPPTGEEGNGFITEARDWRYKNCAVELYRRYFSPDMFYVFPLIVNQQSAVGLDFTDCHTSLIFGMPQVGDNARPTREARQERIRLRRLGRQPRPADGLPSPLGSVSWRIHDAAEVAAIGTGVVQGGANREMNPGSVAMMNGSRPQVLLEVLFIAVWETDRGGEFGSRLVASLECKLIQYAKEHGHKSAIMYVEIGFEQPLAKQFWSNNGFVPVVAKENHTHSQDNVLTGRLIELEDWRLGFIDRRCLRFKDTQQYGKRVLCV